MDRLELEWFLAQMDLILEDNLLEDQGDELEFYWDARDVEAAVLGFNSFYDSSGAFDHARFDDGRALIGCLAGSGWFGPIRLLPPHQAEFLNHLRSGFRLADDTITDTHIGKLLLDCGFSRYFPALGPLTELSSDSILSIIQLQADEAPTLFKIVYCATGSWKQRLSLWVRESRLQVDTESFDYAAVVNSPRCRSLRNRFDYYRPHLLINNLADAVAICLLADKLQSYQSGLSRTIPRFFASGWLYKTVIEEAGCGRMLQCAKDGQSISVLRSSDYYTFKAALRATDENGAPGSSSRAELIRWLTGIREIVCAIVDSHLPADALEEVRYAGYPITSLIQCLKKFWFLENVWLPFWRQALT